MKYIIYLTTNLKSLIDGVNRIYLGVHYTNPEINDGYLGDGVYKLKASTFMYPKTPFQCAVKKYGTESFFRTTLYITDSKEDAFHQLYDILTWNFLKQPHVYNVGNYIHECPDYNMPLYQFDLQGNLKKTWSTLLEAADFYAESAVRFENAAYNGSPFINFYWSNTLENNCFNNTKCQYVFLYTNKLLIEFNTHRDATEYLNCDENELNNAILNHGKIGDCYISNKLLDEFNPKPRRTLKNASIYVYKKSEYLGCYVGKKVMNVIDCHSFKTIFDTLDGWYKDFYISRTKVDKIPEKVKKQYKFEVFDKYGNFIELVKDLRVLKDKYKLKACTINKIIRGVKYQGDYIFKYSK